MADDTDPNALWLETLQQVAGRAAHEIKGALNGVSVNLEVVRGRAAQQDQPASAVARFAGAAATQLDAVIDMNEALLALTRRGREPADVSVTLQSVAALLKPVALAAGTPISVVGLADPISTDTGAPALAVRVVLARAMLALLDAGGGQMQLRGVEGSIAVTATGTRGTLELDPRTAACAATAGIRCTAEGPALTLTFPVPAPPLAHAGAATHGTA